VITDGYSAYEIYVQHWLHEKVGFYSWVKTWVDKFEDGKDYVRLSKNIYDNNHNTVGYMYDYYVDARIMPKLCASEFSPFYADREETIKKCRELNSLGV